MEQPNFKRVGNNAFAVEGDSVTGTISEFTDNEMGGRVAHIETSEGVTKVNLGTVLETKFEQGDVKVGSLVRITYKGEKYSEKSRRTYKDFEVEVAE